MCQSNSFGEVSGVLKDTKGELIPFAHIQITQLGLNAISDTNGYFIIKKVPKGHYELVISSLGFRIKKQWVEVKTDSKTNLQFEIERDIKQLGEFEVLEEFEKTESEKIEQIGFSVEVIETKELKKQSIDINDVLDHSAGIRVRKSGGLGSALNYSLDGMGGKSVRFFVDGIPVDYFGSVYNSNNIPISLIDRVDVYKGVVPVDLGSDALGGAVNIVTKKRQENFLDASYSYGTFNTHRATMQVQYRHKSTGLTLRGSAFRNYSDNNYAVWGSAVTYADKSTGYRTVEFTKENPAFRFNDDYKSTSYKVDFGVTDKKWADQLLISMLSSELDQGVQHGQTMASVYGEMRYEELFLMPSLKYKKDSLFSTGFSFSFFGGLSSTTGVSIDTTTKTYDWREEVISIDPDGGERTNQRSLFTLEEKSKIVSTKLSYDFSKSVELVANYVFKDIVRTGGDEFTPWYTIPYTEPQYLKTQYLGFSLNTKLFDEKLRASFFAKHYRYYASLNTEEYIIGNDDYIKEVVNDSNFTGGGVAISFQLSKKLLIKTSFEKAIRLPDATEALGNGYNIVNSPYIQPEKSFNFNLGLSLGKFHIKDNNSFKLDLNTFFRNTEDLIQMSVVSSQGDGQFYNISKILGQGIEMELSYAYKKWLQVVVNGTYLDLRNNLAYDDYGNYNIVYWDRLKNTPYIMANAGVKTKFEDLIQEKSMTNFYIQSSYVHQYFFGWPSLGSTRSKHIIPYQIVLYTGLSYTIPNQLVSVAFDVSNVLDAQVYDNFYLQKPGRVFSIKLSFHLANSLKSK